VEDFSEHDVKNSFENAIPCHWECVKSENISLSCDVNDYVYS